MLITGKTLKKVFQITLRHFDFCVKNLPVTVPVNEDFHLK